MRWVVMLLLSGCSSILGIDDFKLGDAAMPGEGGGNDYCLGPTGWRVCVATEPTEVKTPIESLNFDTSTNTSLCLAMQPASWKASGQPDACIIVAKSITFGTAVKVSGGRPLVVFASDSITVTGQIDAASHGGSPPSTGPASAASSCLAPVAAGGSTSGGGGAGGGSFMTKGGDGGNATVASGTRGTAAAADAQSPILLRGGCNGGTGGVGTDAGGVSGKGGGAVYLVAGNRITINGFINVSGSAGQGLGRMAGGGGGGSGGMIVLHAPMIGGNGGVLLANGGGGGGGGTGNIGGQAGGEPVPTMPGSIAQGGAGGGGGGGIGGNGFAGTMQAGIGANGSPGTPAAGGGGGGGAGYIRVNEVPMLITSSPAVSRVQVAF